MKWNANIVLFITELKAAISLELKLADIDSGYADVERVTICSRCMF